MTTTSTHNKITWYIFTFYWSWLWYSTCDEHEEWHDRRSQFSTDVSLPPLDRPRYFLQTPLIKKAWGSSVTLHQMPKDTNVCQCLRGGRIESPSHVQRHLFLWQASGSDEQPSESLSEEDGPAKAGTGKLEDCSAPSGVSSIVPQLPVRLSTQPSLLWSKWRRPGGRGNTSRMSIQSGTSWRRRAQHRYSREVGAEQDLMTFMLLFAAVEHAIG